MALMRGPDEPGAGCGVLDGSVLGIRGGSVSADLAARHLRALGCAITRPDLPAPDGGPPSGAGRLSLNGGRSPLPPVDCAIDWTGPVDASLPDDISVQAACGIMQVHGRKSGVPEVLAVDFASSAAGVLATQGILAALIGQVRGVDTRQVTTSVAQAALLCVSQYLAAASTDDDWKETEDTGGPPFTSAEGIRFEIEVLDADGWQRFWRLVGADQGAIKHGWYPFLQRYVVATCPLPDELHHATRRSSFAALSAAARDAGIDIMELRDAAHSSTAGSAERPGGTAPWRLTPMPGRPQEAVPSPAAARAGLPLDGIRVVESCRRIQGPLAGHVLSLLGAQVVRIEPPGGDPLRGMPPIAGDCSARFLALNRGKEAVEIDLKSAAGRRAVHELVAGADVFVHNWAPGRAASLQLDSEHLVAVRPGLVYAHASGWGDALGARPPLGTDFLVQAYSGLAATVRPPDEDPAPSLMTLTDLMGGLVCAEGVLAGLLARLRTGAGQRVDSSLLSAAMVIQEPGRAVPRQHRPLPTSDGYLVLSARSWQEPDRVAAVCGVHPGGEFADVAARFRGEPTDTWVRRLDQAGLSGVAVCTDLAALAVDPRFASALQRQDCTLPRAPWEFAS